MGSGVGSYLLGWLSFGILLVGMSAASAADYCPEWVPPVATDQTPRSPELGKPTRFLPMVGEGSIPALDFIGDSLTASNGARFARTTAALSESRAYEVFAIGEQDSFTLANLFDAVPVAADDVWIIWVGRNSVYDQRVLGDVERIADRFPSGRFIVVGVLVGRYAKERPGEPRRKQLDKLNASLGARFGERFAETSSLVACDEYSNDIHLNDTSYDKAARTGDSKIH